MAAEGQPDAPATAEPTGVADSLVYVYAIVEAETAAHVQLAARAIPGLTLGEPLFPIAAGGLVAAASRVPSSTFQEEALNALASDLQRLAPYAVGHEAAVSALQRAAPALIPLTFGAVYHHPARVTQLLQEQADLLRDLLARVRDREEWGVKVFLTPATLRGAVDQSSPALRALDAEAQAAPPGRSYLLRKGRERLAQAEATRIAEAALLAILERLAAASVDLNRDTLPNGGSPAATETTEQLVLKVACLVDRTAVDAFQRVTADLAGTFAPSGFRLELTGPWAPYSFTRSAAR
jgi:hypothetical protein